MQTILFYEKETIEKVTGSAKLLIDVLKKKEAGESNWTTDAIIHALQMYIINELRDQTAGELRLKQPEP